MTDQERLCQYLHALAQESPTPPLAPESFAPANRQLAREVHRVAAQLLCARQRVLELRDSNEMLIQLTGNINDLILVTDSCGGRVRYCNKDVTGLTGQPMAMSPQAYREIRARLVAYDPAQQGRHWQIFFEPDLRFYQINSFPIDWEGSRSYVHVVADITEMRLREQNLTQQVYLDPATGAYNRRYCYDLMRVYLRDHIPFVLCYMDLNNLKHVNDTFGHAVGDAYIQALVDIVRRGIRKKDTLARIGGDEFLAVFLECPVELVQRKAREFATALRAAFPQDPLPVARSLSYGIVEAPAAGKLSLEELLALGDERMYAHKRQFKTLAQQDSVADKPLAPAQ